MRVIHTSHSMSQCFCCWIDIIIMTTWTGHGIDDVRCVTCLNLSNSSSMTIKYLMKTYGWTIQICSISIDKLMHCTWNKVNDWPWLTFSILIWWITAWTKQLTTWNHCISCFRLMFSTEKTFDSRSRISFSKRASFHIEHVHWEECSNDEDETDLMCIYEEDSPSICR